MNEWPPPVVVKQSQNIESDHAHEILGVSKDASATEIRAARRRLSLKYQKEAVGVGGADPQIMAKINRATADMLDELKVPKKRARGSKGQKSIPEVRAIEDKTAPTLAPPNDGNEIDSVKRKKVLKRLKDQQPLSPALSDEFTNKSPESEPSIPSVEFIPRSKWKGEEVEGVILSEEQPKRSPKKEEAASLLTEPELILNEPLPPYPDEAIIAEAHAIHGVEQEIARKKLIKETADAAEEAYAVGLMTELNHLESKSEGDPVRQNEGIDTLEGHEQSVPVSNSGSHEHTAREGKHGHGNHHGSHAEHAHHGGGFFKRWWMRAVGFFGFIGYHLKHMWDHRPEWDWGSVGEIFKFGGGGHKKKEDHGHGGHH